MQCYPPSLECFLGKCTECPGVEILCAELQVIMDEHEIDSVEYRQWINTDRSSLETEVQTVDEFLSSFSRMLEKLLVHDLIIKMQDEILGLGSSCWWLTYRKTLVLWSRMKYKLSTGTTVQQPFILSYVTLQGQRRAEECLLYCHILT